MATTTTSLARTNRSLRTSGGSGIVTAGDRKRAFARARINSAVVRVLRVTMPLLIVGIIGIYGVLFTQMSGLTGGTLRLPIPKILPEHLTMQNPSYEGFSKDGGSYVIKADAATQDLTQTNLIGLTAIVGTMLDAAKARTDLTAKRGVFNTSTNVVELLDGITIAGENGFRATLEQATVDTKESLVTAKTPVIVEMTAGSVRAKQMTVRQKLKEITFVESVVAQVIPAKKAAPPTRPVADAAAGVPPPAPASLFAASDAPIDITANRLDVDDKVKSAVFTGTVKAVQAETTITTPELAVFYDGKVATPAGSAERQTAGTQLRRIVAKDPVVITRLNGDQITSQSAEFDAANDTAILIGQVAVVSLPDRQANGDRVEYNARANTTLLTGQVVVIQGKNQLRGRRLFLDQARGLTQLSAPAENGGAAGRIAARFVQNRPATAVAPASKGSAVAAEPATAPFGGGTFKSDPSAPVDIQADTLDVDDPAKTATFRGAVYAKQGEFAIRSDQLDAHYSGAAGMAGAGPGAADQKPRPAGTAAQLQRIEARRNVVVTSANGQSATGDWATFDIKKNTAVVGGKVVLTQGPNSVRGTRLLIDMTTGESVVQNEGAVRPVAAGADGAATSTDGAASPEGGRRPSATFFPNRLKEKQLPKAPVTGPSGKTSSWQVDTAP